VNDIKNADPRRKPESDVALLAAIGEYEALGIGKEGDSLLERDRVSSVPSIAGLAMVLFLLWMPLPELRTIRK